MKLLFVLEHFYPYIGGAEKLFYVLTTNLVNDGIDVTVITTQYNKELPLFEIHKGVRIIRIKCQNRFAFTFLSLPQIIKTGRHCDLIHTTTYNAALPSFIGGFFLRKPVFVTFHEVWGNLWKRLPFISSLEKYAFYFYEKLLLNLPFNKFIAVSEFTKSKLIECGIPQHKVVRIHNGIDYSSFDNHQHNPPKIFTFTYFGRLGISKGLNLLIPAAAGFRKSYPNTKFKLIIPKQPKPIFKKIKALINQNNLDNYIEFQHNLSQTKLYEELLNSSCVVIPSFSEGFCFAAAETVALKIPIISSHQGALQEVVSGKMIVMEKMEVQALIDALKKAYQKEWSEIPIRHYHLNSSIKRYKIVYSSFKEENT